MPRIQTNNVETYYERYGDGHPLVFIHGAWLGHRVWGPQIDALTDGYEAIVYDIRGHGRTGSSADRRYTIELFAADLKALVDALELERPYICGLSLGSMIAQTYAARYPDTLEALVLAGALASTRVTLSDTILSTLFPKRLLTGAVRLFGPELAFDIVVRVARWTGSEEWFGRNEHVRAYTRQAKDAIRPTEFNKIFRAIMTYRLIDLASISVPTLVVVGEEDTESIFASAEQLQRTIPDVRATAIPDASHTVSKDNPARFNDILRRFLAELDNGTTGDSSKPR